MPYLAQIFEEIVAVFKPVNWGVSTSPLYARGTPQLFSHFLGFGTAGWTAAFPCIPPRMASITRLDFPSSGHVLVATGLEGLGTLSRQMQAYNIDRCYSVTSLGVSVVTALGVVCTDIREGKDGVTMVPVECAGKVARTKVGVVLHLGFRGALGAGYAPRHLCAALRASG